MVFHWSLSDSKFSQVTRTLLSILTDLNNVVIWMVSTRPLISKSSSPFMNPLVTVSRELITIAINVIFMFHSFFNSQQGRGIYPSFHFLSILLCGRAGHQSSQFWKFSFFIYFILFFFIRFSRLGEICMSKSQRSLWGHSPEKTVDCVYTICSYDQISISCSIPSGSLCLPSLVSFMSFSH